MVSTKPIMLDLFDAIELHGPRLWEQFQLDDVGPCATIGSVSDSLLRNMQTSGLLQVIV